MRTPLAFLLLILASASFAQKPLYAYAIGNWRNGPTVQMTEVFQTSERFTTEQIMERVMKEYEGFKKVMDHDLLLFTDSVEARNNQSILVHKYAQRQLAVSVRRADGTVVQEVVPGVREVKDANGVKEANRLRTLKEVETRPAESVPAPTKP